MSGILLDTHVWAWSIVQSPRLSRTMIDAISKAGSVHVSPISFFEISQKVRLGKWPEMEALSPDLEDILMRQNGQITPLSPGICLAAGHLDWPHRDPFDRLLAATALDLGMTLASADRVFTTLPGLKLVA